MNSMARPNAVAAMVALVMAAPQPVADAAARFIRTSAAAVLTASS